MTWLARISLDYETVSRLHVRNCYDWHKKAWEFFPGRPKGHPRPFLFRAIEKDDVCDFWIMCHEEPTKPVWAKNLYWKANAIKEGFPFHHRYLFDLLANPTRRDKERDAWNGRAPKHRRFNLKTPEEHEAWLVRKSEEHGFRIANDSGNRLLVDFDPRRDYTFTYRDRAPGNHVGTRYRGVLEVIDREKFALAYKYGIGSAKSFGFGLLLLAPNTIN